MSLFHNPLRVKYIRFLRLYRATYKDCASYGRTPKEAVDRVRKRYDNTKLSLGNILNAVIISILPPYT